MRRAQAVFLILSLLAVPLALMTCVDSCDQVVCPCCANMGHGKAMNCRSGMAGICAMSGRGETQKLPAFLLAAHQARTAALPFATVAAPPFKRATFVAFVPSLSSGFHAVPFEPPRA
jgi:hypothetical protein